MKKEMKAYLVGWLSGVILGASLISGFLFQEQRNTAFWKLQWTTTRDAWILERRDWEHGKPFQRHYGPYGSRW